MIIRLNEYKNSTIRCIDILRVPKSCLLKLCCFFPLSASVCYFRNQWNATVFYKLVSGEGELVAMRAMIDSPKNVARRFKLVTHFSQSLITHCTLKSVLLPRGPSHLENSPRMFNPFQNYMLERIGTHDDRERERGREKFITGESTMREGTNWVQSISSCDALSSDCSAECSRMMEKRKNKCEDFAFHDVRNKFVSSASKTF